MCCARCACSVPCMQRACSELNCSAHVCACMLGSPRPRRAKSTSSARRRAAAPRHLARRDRPMHGSTHTWRVGAQHSTVLCLPCTYHTSLTLSARSIQGFARNPAASASAPSTPSRQLCSSSVSTAAFAGHPSERTTDSTPPAPRRQPLRRTTVGEVISSLISSRRAALQRHRR